MPIIHSQAPLAEPLLDAVQGIAYLVDREGRIAAVGRRSWRRFARDNGGDTIADPDTVIGRPLRDFIDGERIAGVADAMIAAVGDRRRDVMTQSFNCDAPDRVRQMRLTVSRVEWSAAPAMLLFHSVTLAEQMRPAAAILLSPSPAAAPDLPVVTVCSYCKLVRDRASGEWLEPADYYRGGGSEDVALSHGICPRCEVDTVDRLLREAEAPVA